MSWTKAIFRRKDFQYKRSKSLKQNPQKKPLNEPEKKRAYKLPDFEHTA